MTDIDPDDLMHKEASKTVSARELIDVLRTSFIERTEKTIEVIAKLYFRGDLFLRFVC